jgi:hypothetical protein
MLGGHVYGDKSSWYSLTSPVLRYIYQDMGCLPELAPPGQNHLLRTATEIRDISYSKEKISYRSLPHSIELLKLAARPKEIRVANRAVPAAGSLSGAEGWIFNPRSNVLLVAHGEPQVEVIL